MGLSFFIFQWEHSLKRHDPIKKIIMRTKLPSPFHLAFCFNLSSRGTALLKKNPK